MCCLSVIVMQQICWGGFSDYQVKGEERSHLDTSTPWASDPSDPSTRTKVIPLRQPSARSSGFGSDEQNTNSESLPLSYRQNQAVDSPDRNRSA